MCVYVAARLGVATATAAAGTKAAASSTVPRTMANQSFRTIHFFPI